LIESGKLCSRNGVIRARFWTSFYNVRLYADTLLENINARSTHQSWATDLQRLGSQTEPKKIAASRGHAARLVMDGNALACPLSRLRREGQTLKVSHAFVS
jgi:hypothetical protein